MERNHWILRPNGKPAVVVQYGIAKNVPDWENGGRWKAVRRYQVEWYSRRKGTVRRAWYDETEVREV